MRPAMVRACVLAFALALAGCAALAPRPVPPELRSAQVRVVVLSLPLVRLGIDLAVYNPNAVDIEIAAVDVAISVEGEPVGQAMLAQPVTLPRQAEAALMMEARGHLGAALAGVARSLLRGGGPLRYEMNGTVQLASGASYPFRRSSILAHL